MLNSFAVGLIIGVLIAVAAVMLVLMVVFRSLTMRNAKQLSRAIQRLSDFGQDLDTIVLETKNDEFIQFRKYILNENDWGVDFVLPLVEISASRQKEILKLAEKYDAKLVKTKTKFGWDFVFVQVTREQKPIPTLVEELIDVLDFPLSSGVGYGGGTTLKLGNRKKVLGNSDNTCSGLHRYTMVDE